MLCGKGGKLMTKDERELVEQAHREAVERYRQQKEEGRKLVEAMFREALEREREVKRRKRAPVEQVHREAIEQGRVQSLPPREPPRGVHYTELPEAKPGEPLAEEWNTYRREVGRWLSEGLEGRHVLIKGEKVLGFYDTSEEARAVGLKLYLLQPFLVHPIRTEEPYLRIRGINHPWPISPLP
jgi:hypothetical protein